jgi:LacI family transcriptional regulator
MAATLKEIAQLCGVSVATASQALNNKPVNAHTRKRVFEAASRLGYQPSVLARGLRTNKTFTLGLTLGYPNLELIDSVVRTAQKAGYHVITQSFPQEAMDYDEKLERQAYQDLLLRRVDGVIMWPSERVTDYFQIVDDFHRHNIPVVVVDRKLAGVNVPTVMFDNRRGARLAWLHLNRLGRDPIVYLDFTEDYSSLIARREGIRDAHLATGVRWNDANYVRVLGRNGLDTDKMRLALDHARNGGAILAGADHIAFAVLRLAAQMNIRIPEEMALVGFEDVVIWLKERVGWTTSPPLSTVRMRFEQVGRDATELLLSMIDHKNEMLPHSEETHFIEPQLVLRKSCGGCPGIYTFADDETSVLLEQEQF